MRILNSGEHDYVLAIKYFSEARKEEYKKEMIVREKSINDYIESLLA
jgi:hypothetical protein